MKEYVQPFDYAKETYESGLVSQVVSSVGKTSSTATSTTYNYTYDGNGNIIQITDGSGMDSRGRLSTVTTKSMSSIAYYCIKHLEYQKTFYSAIP